MLRTRVGYTGGAKANPTYHSLGDHTESFQIDYDPSILSYGQILEIFWDSHRCTMPSYSRQYMAAIFYHNDQQQKLALESLQKKEKVLGKKIQTDVLPLETFYLAEDYHQKYYLQSRRDIVAELYQIFPNFQDFIDSTVVAKMNGYIGGYGEYSQLLLEIDSFGLSPATKQRLLNAVKE